MLFIGVAIAIALGLVLLISTDAGALVGLTQDQTAQAIPIGIIAVLLAASFFARRYPLRELLGNLVLWAGIFGMALLGYTYREDLSGVASRVFGELMPGAAVVDTERGTATFRSGINGHFPIKAAIDGVEVQTVFDTGASAVVLTNGDAKKIGLDTGVLDYNVPVSTANGTGRAALVTLDRIVVGDIERTNVRAFIAEKGMLDTSLLGMSFLGTLSRYAVSGNSLELTD